MDLLRKEGNEGLMLRNPKTHRPTIKCHLKITISTNDYIMNWKAWVITSSVDYVILILISMKYDMGLWTNNVITHIIFH